MATVDLPVELGDAIVRARGLTRSYQVGESVVHALRSVDLDVLPGEFLGVVGVSGSGKSTLLHVIGGLDAPTSGDVTVAGAALGAMSRKGRSMYRRNTVGFVFQSFYLIPALSALGNLKLALTLQGVYGKSRDELAWAALERVGLADRAEHRPGQLSVGQQQRVAVARALLHRPPLLLADEPTANLDRANAIHLMDMLAELREGLGTTVVMVTHDQALAQRYCTRTVAMADGRLEPGGEKAP
ncbi:MAG: ABC transporter ATP-binding protein [Pirellulales bacterium]|nr:ABC transporter ATP-binding protein [Pirellulales bacterium]